MAPSPKPARASVFPAPSSYLSAGACRTAAESTRIPPPFHWAWGLRSGWTASSQIYDVQFTASTLGSVSIAISLCSLLRKTKTGVARTDSVIWIIMKYSISACVLTSLVNIGSIVALAVAPTTPMYVAVMPIQPKIVLNSLLAFLNSRDSFTRETTAPVSVRLSKLQPSGPASNQYLYGSRVSVFDTKDVDRPTHILSSADNGV